MEKVGAYTDRATESGEWRGGNPASGQQATPMLAAYFNMLQRELVALVEAADIELDVEDDAQLLKAVTSLIERQTPEKVIITVQNSVQLSAAQMGLVLGNASASSITVTLPPSKDVGVTDVIVRRTDNSGNRLSVAASGADRIKFHTHLRPAGYPFFVLMGAGDWWHLRSDGDGSWWPIGRYDGTALGRPVFETTTAIGPGGWGALAGSLFNRADWPWLWDHAQQSGMLVAESARAGMEGGWTSGDGTTTFRGPEARGDFVRFLDEARLVDRLVVTATATAGSNVLRSVIYPAGNIPAVGQTVTGTGIPAGTTVTSFTTDTITLSANATVTTSLFASLLGRVPGSWQRAATGPHFHQAIGGVGYGYGYYQGGTISSDAGRNNYPDYTDVNPTMEHPENRPRNVALPGRHKLI